MLLSIKNNWFWNIRHDVLAGLVVALALIPESIAFSIIAGVDPKIGLYASFCIAIVISFAGGRPAMISAATGAMALLVVDLVKDYGLQYLLATTILTGILQVCAGYLKMGALMRFVPSSVVTGFVNALAILIFMAQLPELTNVAWYVYPITLAGLAIVYLFPYIPRIGKLLPAPLVCIVVLTLFVSVTGLDLRTVGDMGELPDALPVFLIPDIPFNLETLRIILPYALALTVVGLLESMMTATIIDDFTDTTSDKNRECKGQGIANVVTGFMGGMPGCGMIGQSVINVKSGGRTRLSSFCAGLFLLIMVVFMSDWISIIPMAALVAIMIMVSIGSFDWNSVRDFRRKPKFVNIVMLVTVAVVLYTHNLAYGVVTGTLLAMIFFVYKVEKLFSIRSMVNEAETHRRYIIKGQVFFSSSDKFMQSFDFKETLKYVVIDVSDAHLWDVTAILALDQVVNKFKQAGISVTIEGLNEESTHLLSKFSQHDDLVKS